MTPFEQSFLEQVTNMHGTDFSTWQGWQALMEWIKKQPWNKEFFGGEKIPARLLYPAQLVTDLTKYLGG